jgi:hypothetical protein
MASQQHNNQHGIALACKLINEQHGPVVEVGGVANSPPKAPSPSPRAQALSDPSALLMPQAVAKQLMRRGRQSLPELTRACEQPQQLVKQAMLVLLQHNHASAYTVRPEPDALVTRQAFCVYQADLARTLSCLRQPRMLYHIRCAGLLHLRPRNTGCADCAGALQQRWVCRLRSRPLHPSAASCPCTPPYAPPHPPAAGGPSSKRP